MALWTFSDAQEADHQIGYSPKIGLCTVIRIAWYWEETTEAGFKDADELGVIDEYGKNMPLKEFRISVGVKNIT